MRLIASVFFLISFSASLFAFTMGSERFSKEPVVSVNLARFTETTGSLEKRSEPIVKANKLAEKLIKKKTEAISRITFSFKSF